MAINRKNVFLIGMIFLFVTIFLFIKLVSGLNATVCCQKTTSNFYCQNVPANECASGSLQAPTLCDSTSFCKPGICYNPNQGTCAASTPQFVCNLAGGQWSAASLPQCELGCCNLGDQAAFVTLVRCKYLAGKLGLQTNYDKTVKDEVQCVLSVQNQDKGACVYESEFEKICKFTTREECGAGVNGTQTKGEFFKGKLCTSPELGTKCAKTTKTTCVPGKEEVYFVDNCGNPANIYDASKINNLDYWSNVKDKTQSCNPSLDNTNSQKCGNCDYLSGSICRTANTNVQPTYGDNMCADLNCKNTANGKSYRHGESWCVYDDKGSNSAGKDSVGSRFYKHICINGEETLEQCADFRQEECIEDKILIGTGDGFSQAACRVNRWQDCIVQTEQLDCENSDKRDCIWKAGVTASLSNSSAGICLPKNPPGLKFWEGDEAKNTCAKANELCIVSSEQGFFGGKSYKDNSAQCLTSQWQQERQDICNSLGDCGPNTNWFGQQGFKPGFKVTTGKA